MYNTVTCNYHQSLRRYCFSQSVTNIHIFPPFSDKYLCPICFSFLSQPSGSAICILHTDIFPVALERYLFQFSLRLFLFLFLYYICTHFLSKVAPSPDTQRTNVSLDNVFFIVSLLSCCFRLSCLPFQPASFITNKQVYNFRLARLVEALRNKPEGRGFDSRWCHWNFSLI
jgi:hypothetical protein